MDRAVATRARRSTRAAFAGGRLALRHALEAQLLESRVADGTEGYCVSHDSPTGFLN